MKVSALMNFSALLLLCLLAIVSLNLIENVFGAESYITPNGKWFSMDNVEFKIDMGGLDPEDYVNYSCNYEIIENSDVCPESETQFIESLGSSGNITCDPGALCNKVVCYYCKVNRTNRTRIHDPESNKPWKFIWFVENWTEIYGINRSDPFIINIPNGSIEVTVNKTLEGELILGAPVNIILTGTVNFLTQTIPVDVMLIMDRSGSMSGDKITQSKTAAIIFTNQILSKDRIGLTSFASTATLEAGLTTNKDLVKTKINSLVASGMTAMGDGMYVSLKELENNARSDVLKFAVLLTDGHHNSGSKTPLEEAQWAKNLNISIYTIGLGAGADENLLIKIASETNGKYFFSPTEEELGNIYQQVAQDIYARASNNKIYDFLPLSAEVIDSDGGTVNQITLNEETYRIIAWNHGLITPLTPLLINYTVAFHEFGEQQICFENKSVISYADVDGSKQFKYFPLINGSKTVQIPYIDLAFLDLDGIVKKDLSSNLNSVILNNGTITSIPTKIAFYNKSALGNKFGTVEVSSLVVNASDEFTFIWNIPDNNTLKYEIYGVVDPYNEIEEPNEDNNIREFILWNDWTPPQVFCDQAYEQEDVNLIFSPKIKDVGAGVGRVRLCKDAYCKEVFCEYDGNETSSCVYAVDECTFENVGFWIFASDKALNTNLTYCGDIEVKKSLNCVCSYSTECDSGLCEGGPTLCTENPIPQLYFI